jgi:uncharacterized membrane protein YfcA
VFASISLFASFVNGALGYGFSSLAVPLAVLFFPNKVLNPAFVIVELLVNSAMMVYERGHFRKVIPRTLPVIISLLPGVVVGSFLLTIVNAQYVKIFLYVFMLPLILLQAAGLRKPIKSELAFKFPFGVGLGLCYSLTTISGPPLALFWNNQGLAKNEFRAGLAQVRFAETVYTSIAYFMLGLYNPTSSQLTLILLIPMLIGLPIGAFCVKRLDVPTFRRICMSFDAWIVGYGLSSILSGAYFGTTAYLILIVVIIIDAILLYYFFTRQRKILQQ